MKKYATLKCIQDKNSVVQKQNKTPTFKQTDKVQAYEVADSPENRNEMEMQIFFVLKTKLRQIQVIYLITIY